MNEKIFLCILNYFTYFCSLSFFLHFSQSFYITIAIFVYVRVRIYMHGLLLENVITSPKNTSKEFKKKNKKIK